MGDGGTVGPDRGRLLSTEGLRHWLGDLLGTPPAAMELYRRAFTHGSTAEPDYQRLEFLGDRVLGLAISELLYAEFPHEPEGRLSHRLNALVSRQVCAAIGRKHGFGPHIRLGKQARDDGAVDSDNVLGDVVEALLGAVYVDQGFDAACTLIRRLWRERIDADEKAPVHPKSALQEWAAAHRRKTPHYEITGRSGPAHATTFEVTVTVKGYDPISATGSSKQEAEKRAAALFLEKHA